MHSLSYLSLCHKHPHSSMCFRHGIQAYSLSCRASSRTESFFAILVIIIDHIPLLGGCCGYWHFVKTSHWTQLGVNKWGIWMGGLTMFDLIHGRPLDSDEICKIHIHCNKIHKASHSTELISSTLWSQNKTTHTLTKHWLTVSTRVSIAMAACRHESRTWKRVEELRSGSPGEPGETSRTTSQQNINLQ